MQRLLAVLLILIGVIGLVLGRLGETTWAPPTKTTATVELSNPGPAVVIDPGVLYVGGQKGEVSIEGASDVSLITADNSDIEAYLADTAYTRITGASDWTTLSTESVNPDGTAELTDPTGSDLWRTVETKPSPYTFEIADFAAGEHGDNQQAYRATLVVTDGTEAGADSISITWPVEDENEWVPFAYAGGAAIAVIGLVLLVVSIGGRRREDDEDAELEAADAAAETDRNAVDPDPDPDAEAGAAADTTSGADPDTDADHDAEPAPDADHDAEPDPDSDAAGPALGTGAMTSGAAARSDAEESSAEENDAEENDAVEGDAVGSDPESDGMTSDGPAHPSHDDTEVLAPVEGDGDDVADPDAARRNPTDPDGNAWDLGEDHDTPDDLNSEDRR